MLANQTGRFKYCKDATRLARVKDPVVSVKVRRITETRQDPNQNTQEVKNERFFKYRQHKNKVGISAYVAFNKATNGQTDIKHEQ